MVDEKPKAKSRQLNKRYLKWGVRALSLAVVTGIWQYFGMQVDSIILPTPISVAQSVVTLFADGAIPTRLAQTLEAAILGYGIAVASGIGLGSAMARWRHFEVGIDPYVNMLMATPFVALIPIFVIWLGTGFEARLAIVVISTIFPITINTLNGFKNVSRDFVETARSFGCSGVSLYRKVIIPAALPYIIAGLRISIAHALAAALLAEMFLQIVGLGYLILVFQNILQMANMVAVVLTVAAVSLVLTETLKFTERKVAPWRAASTGG